MDFVLVSSNSEVIRLDIQKAHEQAENTGDIALAPLKIPAIANICSTECTYFYKNNQDVCLPIY